MIRLSFSFEFEIGRRSKRGITFESWQRLKPIVKKRDGTICQYCGHPAPDGHVDHKIPLSRGGTDSLDNLVWACPDCNLSKSNKTPQEWHESKAESLVLEVIKHDDNGVDLGPDILSVDGVDIAIMQEFAHQILGGASMTTHAWVGPSGLFSQGQFSALMIRLEQLEYVKPGRGAKPRELTPLGRSVFEQLVALA